MADGNPQSPPQIMGWPKIIAITLAAGLVTGLVLGIGSTALGLSGANLGAGVGVVEGLVLVLLLRQRQQALAANSERGG